jgi:hypothetical protein
MEATIQVCQEEMRAEIKTGLEEMKAIEPEAIAEPYKWVSCVKAMHMLTAPQGWASDVLHGAPKGPTLEKR